MYAMKCYLTTHNNGHIEEERVTPIEARSLVKIIEAY